MDLLAPSAAAISRLALAEAFNGPPLARVAPRRKDGGVSSKQELSKVLKAGWSLPDALMNAIAAVGWLSERKTLRSRPLARDAHAAVTFKDLLMAGVVITSAATIAGVEVMKRVYPDGVCITAKGEVSPERAAGVDTYLGYFKVMGMLNRVFVAGAIAATPFINFALFNEYKPHPLRSFFAL